MIKAILLLTSVQRVQRRLLGMTVFACLTFFLALSAHAQTVPLISSGVKTEKEIRYQICQVNMAGMPMVLKIDTLTGRTWHLQMAAEQDRKRGVYYVWTEAPSFEAPDLSQPTPSDSH